MENHLKSIREAKKMSQETLGKMLGVSKVSICGYETGTRTPNMSNFLKLIECYCSQNRTMIY